MHAQVGDVVQRAWQKVIVTTAVTGQGAKRACYAAKAQQLSLVELTHVCSLGFRSAAAAAAAAVAPAAAAAAAAAAVLEPGSYAFKLEGRAIREARACPQKYW
jgi:hypothetical protein